MQRLAGCGLCLPKYGEEEGGEHECGACHAAPRDAVAKQHRAEDDGEDLPRGACEGAAQGEGLGEGVAQGKG